MKQKFCIYCGNPVTSEKTVFCAYCGEKIDENSSIPSGNEGGTENNDLNIFNSNVSTNGVSNSNVSDGAVSNRDISTNNVSNNDIGNDTNNDGNDGNFEIKYEKKILIAVLLSLIGWGQYYNGQILKAIIFTFIFGIANAILNIEDDSFFLFIIALIFLIFAIYTIYDAYHNAKFINEHNGNYFYNENLKNMDYIENLEKPKDYREKFHKLDAEFSAKFHRYNKFKHRKDLKDGKIFLTGVVCNLLFRIIGVLLLFPLSVIFGFSL